MNNTHNDLTRSILILMLFIPTIKANDSEHESSILKGLVGGALFGAGLSALMFAIKHEDKLETIMRGCALTTGMLMFGATYKLYAGSSTNYTPLNVSSAEYNLNNLAGSIPEDVTELVKIIKNNKDHAAIGATLPKGILLHGPGGTGKTSIARAIAGETNAAFFSLSGSEFNELYIGLGAKRMRDLFQSARTLIDSKKYPYAIIFIDEIDAIGGSRIGERSTEQRNTLNELLNQMDGFTTRNDIFVIGATNSIQILDKALLRPGRFDKLVKINLPKENDRLKILDQYNQKTINSITEDCLKHLAKNTTKCTGAELKSLINEAASQAIRSGRTVIIDEDYLYALNKIINQKQYRS